MGGRKVIAGWELCVSGQHTKGQSHKLNLMDNEKETESFKVWAKEHHSLARVFKVLSIFIGISVFLVLVSGGNDGSSGDQDSGPYQQSPSQSVELEEVVYNELSIADLHNFSKVEKLDFVEFRAIVDSFGSKGVVVLSDGFGSYAVITQDAQTLTGLNKGDEVVVRGTYLSKVGEMDSSSVFGIEESLNSSPFVLPTQEIEVVKKSSQLSPKIWRQVFSWESKVGEPGDGYRNTGAFEVNRDHWRVRWFVTNGDVGALADDHRFVALFKKVASLNNLSNATSFGQLMDVVVKSGTTESGIYGSTGPGVFYFEYLSVYQTKWSFIVEETY